MICDLDCIIIIFYNNKKIMFMAEARADWRSPPDPRVPRQPRADSWWRPWRPRHCPRWRPRMTGGSDDPWPASPRSWSGLRGSGGSWGWAPGLRRWEGDTERSWTWHRWETSFDLHKNVIENLNDLINIRSHLTVQGWTLSFQSLVWVSHCTRPQSSVQSEQALKQSSINNIRYPEN